MTKKQKILELYKDKLESLGYEIIDKPDLKDQICIKQPIKYGLGYIHPEIYIPNVAFDCSKKDNVSINQSFDVIKPFIEFLEDYLSRIELLEMKEQLDRWEKYLDLIKHFYIIKNFAIIFGREFHLKSPAIGITNSPSWKFFNTLCIIRTKDLIDKLRQNETEINPKDDSVTIFELYQDDVVDLPTQPVEKYTFDMKCIGDLYKQLDRYNISKLEFWEIRALFKTFSILQNRLKIDIGEELSVSILKDSRIIDRLYQDLNNELEPFSQSVFPESKFNELFPLNVDTIIDCINSLNSKTTCPEQLGFSMFVNIFGPVHEETIPY